MLTWSPNPGVSVIDNRNLTFFSSITGEEQCVRNRRCVKCNITHQCSYYVYRRLDRNANCPVCKNLAKNGLTYTMGNSVNLHLPWVTVLISTVLGIFWGGSLVQLVLLTLDLKRVFTSVLLPRPDSPGIIFSVTKTFKQPPSRYYLLILLPKRIYNVCYGRT